MPQFRAAVAAAGRPRRAIVRVVAALCAVVCIAASVPAQSIDADWLRAHYRNVEARIPMRDGVRLFTSIYVPRDTTGQTFPILMTRTPFGAGTYGDSTYRRALGPSGNPRFARDGYVFVVQDVRGTWMSEGRLTMMTPHLASRKSAADVDESSDASDTRTWLLAHVTPNNGRAPFRGRVRRSFAKPVPFTPGVPDSSRFEMPDLNHRVLRGHRIMVQIQSSWFPLIDRNPQTWVPNILEAKPDAFKAAEMRVYHTAMRATRLEVFVLP